MFLRSLKLNFYNNYLKIIIVKLNYQKIKLILLKTMMFDLFRLDPLFSFVSLFLMPF